MTLGRSFVILTTSILGCSLAKGLIKSGHTVLSVGRGSSRKVKNTGLISSADIGRILGPSMPVVEIDLEREIDVEEFLQSSGADFAIVSWPRILSQRIIRSSDTRLIGTHPTPLPLGKGRHPLHWMRVLGIRKSRLTAFWLDESVDGGSVIASLTFRTRSRGDINSDNETLASSGRKMGQMLGFLFMFRIPKGRPQAASKGTFFRARNLEDSRIDFRMSSRAIFDQVRSVKKPWDGCQVLTESGQWVEVLDARLPRWKLLRAELRWATFGARLRSSASQNNTIWTLVRCYRGSIWIETEKEI